MALILTFHYQIFKKLLPFFFFCIFFLYINLYIAELIQHRIILFYKKMLDFVYTANICFSMMMNYYQHYVKNFHS